MYLVLKQDDTAPTGWTPMVMTAADTPQQAAAEANPGHDCTLAVIDWKPATFDLTSEPVVTERDDSPALLARQPGKQSK